MAKPHRGFLNMNCIADGIMKKGTRSTKLIDYEKERNKGISKKIHREYFGLSHLQRRAFRTPLTMIVKNVLDVLSRQMASNLFRGGRSLGTV